MANIGTLFQETMVSKLVFPWKFYFLRVYLDEDKVPSEDSPLDREMGSLEVENPFLKIH